MKTIMIDMDDVIVEGGFLHLINEFLNADYNENDFKDFYMQDIITNKDEFFRFFRTKNLYDYCNLTPDAYEVIKELNNKYIVFIGTSYIFKEIVDDSGYIVEQKYNYLREKLSFLDPYKFIFVGNKSVIKTDIKIDDKIENLEGAKTKLLFSAYHNLEISDEELRKKGIKRVNGWDDVRKKLL